MSIAHALATLSFSESQKKKVIFMRTVSIFKNGENQAVRLPKDMEFEGVSELEIVKDGNSLILRPARLSWISLADYETADDDFLQNREDIIEEVGRITL